MFIITRQTFERWCGALSGIAVALLVGGVLDARQTQAPAQQPATR